MRAAGKCSHPHSAIHASSSPASPASHPATRGPISMSPLAMIKASARKGPKTRAKANRFGRERVSSITQAAFRASVRVKVTAETDHNDMIMPKESKPPPALFSYGLQRFWDLLWRCAHGRFYEPIENRVDPQHRQQRKYQDDEREEPEETPVGQLLRVGGHAMLEEALDRALSQLNNPEH